MNRRIHRFSASDLVGMSLLVACLDVQFAVESKVVDLDLNL